MRASTTVAFLASAATAAVAQMVPPAGMNPLAILQKIQISSGCQTALLQALSSPNVTQCLPVAGLLPAIASNSSLVPALDTFMSGLCYTAPCSNATLMSTAAAIQQGCAADVQASGLPNNTISAAFSIYPTVREVLCLKTADPYTPASYSQYPDGSLGAAPIPITAYNSTGGYFCVSSVLTQLSAYFGANLTVPFLAGIVTGQNQTALNLGMNINLNILCNECIFGALDIVQLAYPVVGNTPLSAVGQLINYTIPINQTINQIANGECAYVPLMVSQNGTLPTNVSVSIVNSTFPYMVTNGDM